MERHVAYFRRYVLSKGSFCLDLLASFSPIAIHPRDDNADRAPPWLRLKKSEINLPALPFAARRDDFEDIVLNEKICVRWNHIFMLVLFDFASPSLPPSVYPTAAINGAARLLQAHTRNLRLSISSGVSDSGVASFMCQFVAERSHKFSEGIFQHLVSNSCALSIFGAQCSQDKFAWRGSALRFQLALCSKPIIKIVAGVASPIQIKLISAMLDLFRFRILFAVGAWLVWMFVMFHILNR